MKVSVVIPVYNVEDYIEECLDSVRNQTFSDLEILCIHDAGTDGSWEKVKKAAEEDGRIRLAENETNKGLSAVRNKGLDLARGDYVYFLDSDDKILPDAMEHLTAIAEKEKLDAAVFCAQFLFEDESFKERFGTNPAVFKGEYPEVTDGKNLFLEWMKNRDWMPSQPRYFYSRQFLIENGLRFREGILHEDEIFAFDVLMHAQRMRVLNDAWFVRRFRKGSIMTKQTTMRNVEGCIHILSHLSEARTAYREDVYLTAAVFHYRKKIADDVRGKYRSVSGQPEDGLFTAFENGPKISVLIPVYNVAPYLEDCLESVLSQSFMDLEVICVDDGSDDGSDVILSEFAAMDPRIRIFTQKENKGQAAARNCALEAARGEYIYMLDADDLIVPGALEELYGIGRSEDPDVIGFENRQFADEPEFLSNAMTPLFTYRDVQGVYTGKEAFITVVKKDVISPSVPTYFLKRSFMEEHHLQFAEGILHEDIGFIFEMLLSAGKVCLLHDALFCRRFRAHSTVTSGFSVKNTEGYLKSWQKAFEYGNTIRKDLEEDEELASAYRKWIRDVLGRIRTLYLTAEDKLYPAEGGSLDEKTELLFEMLKETTTGRARAREILGDETCRILENCQETYVCGGGQYLNRVLDAVGALDVQIRGVFMITEQERIAFRGFPVILPEQAEKDLPVILAVSHYNADLYLDLVQKAGFRQIIQVPF